MADTPGRFATARIIWAALLASVAMYLAVLAVLIAEPSAVPVNVDVGLLRSAFWAICVVVLGVILFFRRALPSLDADPARATSPTADAAFTIYVMCWALADSIALFGLTLGFLSRRLEEALPFLVVAVALLVWQRPRRQHFAS